MDKQPVVYKRRRRKPLQEIQQNASNIHEENKVETGHEDGSKCNSSTRNGRKSWVDRSLSSKGRRSSFCLGESFDISDMVMRWADVLVGTTYKSQEQLNRKNVAGQVQVNKNKRVNPPIEFVKEQQAMFAAVDAFELESEEESPASKPKPGYLDPYRDLYPRKSILEYHKSENESARDFLSSILRTPNSVSTQGHGHELPPDAHSSAHNSVNQKSLYLVSTTGMSRTSLSRAEESSVDLTPMSESSNVRFNGSVVFETEPSSIGDKDIRLSIDNNAIVSRLTGLQIQEDEVTYHQQELIPLAEDDEEASPKTAKRDLTKDTELPSTPNTKGLLPIFEALLDECHQIRPTTLRNAFSEFCDMAKLVKVGEGTFGEAFRGGGCVFKIVPMDGDFLVNSEVQKTSAEIYSEALVTTTLNRLRGQGLQDFTKRANYCKNFIETKAIRICQGSYDKDLCSAWEDWDTLRTSENDHPMIFPEHQLYVVFVLADGGKDLESFVLSGVIEAKSVLLQITIALGVAEEACGFEHRDLHWGNIVLKRDEDEQSRHYTLCGHCLEAKTVGLSVSIIDFTLSRIDTGKHVFFSNLSADPALFEGPSRDIQANTYRRMLTKTKGNWEGSFPQTNCYWIHYVADILLKKKSFRGLLDTYQRCSAQQKRALQSFCKRVLLYESAKAAASDDYFQDMWIKGPQ